MQNYINNLTLSAYKYILTHINYIIILYAYNYASNMQLIFVKNNIRIITNIEIKKACLTVYKRLFNTVRQAIL